VKQSVLYLTLQESLDLHEQLILRFGGPAGVRDMGLLESALIRPQTGYYETLSMQAAALLQSLCQNHCFVDGNKRVAFAATAIFLRMNGYRLIVQANDGETFLIDQIIQKKIAIEDIATWLEGIMRKVRGISTPFLGGPCTAE
jgi:death-on-curing protein